MFEDVRDMMYERCRRCPKLSEGIQSTRNSEDFSDVFRIYSENSEMFEDVRFTMYRCCRSFPKIALAIINTQNYILF